MPSEIAYWHWITAIFKDSFERFTEVGLNLRELAWKFVHYEVVHGTRLLFLQNFDLPVLVFASLCFICPPYSSVDFTQMARSKFFEVELVLQVTANF